MFKKGVLLALIVMVVALTMALSSVSVFAEGYLKLECEEFDDCNPDVNPFDSGQAIKIEPSKTNVGDIFNVGGTFEGGWLLFENVDFGKNGAKKVSIQYCNNSNRCTPEARVELRLGSEDGEVVAEVQLPPTGDNWSTYDIATANMKKIVTGKHDLYLVMLGETTADHKYIANFDFIEFEEAEPGEAPSPTPTQPGETEAPATKDPTETPAQSPDSTATPTKAPTPSPSQTQSSKPGNNSGSSIVIYIVIAVVLISAGVVAFFLIKNKKK